MILDPLQDGMSRLQLLDWMGGDLANVNGARASYSMQKEKFDDKDAKLISRLGADIHHTPLRHTYFQFAIDAPEFVARQWFKHLVGCEYSFKDLPWSEFSQRYKEVEPKFYIPKEIRAQSADNKQASADIVDPKWDIPYLLEMTFTQLYNSYCNMLHAGVAREQARLVLPMATYTSWVWTASIQACVHFCALRDHEGAQWEIQQYAQALTTIIRPLAPHTWDTLLANHPINLKGK